MTTRPDGLLRRRPWVAGLAFVAVGVGMPAAFRAVLPDEPVFPPGGELVPYLVGVCAVVLAAVLVVRGGRRTVEPVSLPRAVRSAVRWRDTVPAQYRDRVPGWIAHQRRLCAQLAVTVIFGVAAQLQLNPDTERLVFYAVVSAVVLSPIGIYAWFVARAGRHLAASLPPGR